MNSFAKFFCLIFFPVAILLGIFIYFNYQINVQNVQEQLFKFMAEKWAAAAALDLEKPSSLNSYNALKKSVDGTGARITLIAEDGSVLNDSATDYKDVASLKNHALRNEFRNANLGEPSYDIRKSASTGKYTVYYAKKLDIPGKDIVLRIAYDASYLDEREKNILKESTAFGFAFLIAAALISAYLARRFSTPVKNLGRLADNIAQGRDDGHFPQFNDPDFDKISEVIYKICSDLTDKKNTAENDREKLQTVFKSMNEGIALLNKNGAVININDKACEYLGIKIYPGQNVVKDGNNIDLIVFFKHLADKAGLTTIKYKDVLFEAYSKQIGDETLIVFNEVTEKLNYETFKTELVGNLTHEIKTPLTLIMGASETILNDKEMNDETRSRFLSTIYKNAVRLNGLVDETMELHRLESAPMGDIYSSQTNLSEITQEMQTLFQSPQNNKEIIYEVPDISVHIRSAHIASVLTNLITNAQKYSNGDKIFVKMEKDKKRLVISVADTGPLIPESERKRIFERFYTVSKSRTKNSAGSGLGLAIVKHIANLYGGKVAVYENDMSGNTFEVILKDRSENSVKNA